MIRILRYAAALWLGLSVAISAESPVVVELYTSQGCSSCPPADALFRKLADREDVIALSMHVDYWDYIGWKDEFADPDHAKRQRDYAFVAGRRSIYTPQMIVNGRTDIIGTRPMELAAAISKYQRTRSLEVSLSRNGSDVTVEVAPQDGFAGPFVLYLMRYQRLREARITRGENRGRTLHYANVVEGLTTLGEWDGATPLEMTVAAPGDLPVVVLVQSGPVGQMAGAQVLR